MVRTFTPQFSCWLLNTLQLSWCCSLPGLSASLSPQPSILHLWDPPEEPPRRQTREALSDHSSTRGLRAPLTLQRGLDVLSAAGTAGARPSLYDLQSSLRSHQQEQRDQGHEFKQATIPFFRLPQVKAPQVKATKRVTPGQSTPAGQIFLGQAAAEQDAPILRCSSAAASCSKGC